MPEPLVKKIVGVLYPTDAWFDWTVQELKMLWGEPEIISVPVPFVNTDYYRDIAPQLFRRFLSFSGLVGAGGLAEWKHASRAVETKSRTPRAVNIDPGYIDGARLVLASTKDHAHRIYLREGIFAEVTLRYRFGKWTSFDYTFPDFASGVYDEFLTSARGSWIENAARKEERQKSLQKGKSR